MAIDRNRFNAIMDGTAANLTAVEILVRHVAYKAEREGGSPLLAVKHELPHIQITEVEGQSGKPTSFSIKNVKSNKHANSTSGVQKKTNLFASLTTSQRKFIEAHEIPYSQVFDARGLKLAQYKTAMQEEDYVIAVNVTPCERHGHQIRSRHGKCVQCNAASIEFQDRKNRNAYVYVCYSEENGFAKIGMTDAPDRRLGVLNSLQYASVSDWKMVFKKECRRAGLIEYESQKMIEKFRIERTYKKDGRIQSCYEIFRCSQKDAIKAVEAALQKI